MWSIAPHPWWEFVLRALIVYGFLLVLLRITGKRQIGQMSPFDLVLLLVLSNAVQNAMNAGDNSVTAGILSASSLIGLNYLIGWMTYRSKKLEHLIEGSPVVLIHDGHINHKAMRGVQMTMHELESALREVGHCGPDKVRFAVLENNGKLTVIGREEECAAQPQV